MKIVMTIAIMAMVAMSPLVAKADDKEIGRFQLITATVQESGPAGTSDAKRLFKIDTATGETWEYVSTVMKRATPRYSGNNATTFCATVQALNKAIDRETGRYRRSRIVYRRD